MDSIWITEATCLLLMAIMMLVTAMKGYPDDSNAVDRNSEYSTTQSTQLKAIPDESESEDISVRVEIKHELLDSVSTNLLAEPNPSASKQEYQIEAISSQKAAWLRTETPSLDDVLLPPVRAQSWVPPNDTAFRQVDSIAEFYLIGRKLGSGGFSEVYEGQDLDTYDAFAIKFVSNTIFSKHRNQMTNEVKTLASFDHPNIVKLREVVRTPTDFCIVTELVDGGELFDHIAEMKKFSEETVRAILRQLLGAVKVLHDANVMHRDLKPENILLKSKDPIRIKVADFGLAAFFDNDVPLTVACGTPEYSSPEVIDMARCSYDRSADVWSIGVITYIMLTGISPFKGRTFDITIQKVLAGAKYPDNLWRHVSPKAKTFVERMLDSNPKTRITVTEALDHEWMSGKAPSSTKPLTRTLTHLEDFNKQRGADKNDLWRMHDEIDAMLRKEGDSPRKALMPPIHSVRGKLSDLQPSLIKPTDPSSLSVRSRVPKPAPKPVVPPSKPVLSVPAPSSRAPARLQRPVSAPVVLPPGNIPKSTPSPSPDSRDYEAYIRSEYWRLISERSVHRWNERYAIESVSEGDQCISESPTERVERLRLRLQALTTLAQTSPIS